MRGFGLALLALLGVTGCMDFDSTWEVRVGIPTQTLAPADLGIAGTATVVPGDAWISIRSWGGSDVTYPVVTDGAELRIESAFDPAAPAHDVLLTMTRLSRETEPAEEHPDVQYATLFVEALVVPTLRDVAAAGQSTLLTIELEANVPPTCGEPPASVGGSVDGCLVGSACDPMPLARRDGLYQMGPIAISVEVLRQDCVE
jgi:hypothetical protein